jgi:hypothetical protein
MKYAYFAACVGAATALSIPQPERLWELTRPLQHRLGSFIPGVSTTGKFLVELEGGEQRWIHEDEKWELRKVK